MTKTTDDTTPRDVSRRRLFRQAGAAGAAVIVAPTLSPAAAQAPRHDPSTTSPSGPQPAARETLTATEADTLEAIVSRLIPADETGPGAAEAGAAIYIDRALNGALRSSRAAYAAGLAAIDDYSMATRGAAFAALPASDQDAILTALETNTATGFMADAPGFFALVRNHTIQGMCCDPYYGGNGEFIGWDLVGYPGLRMSVTEDEQRMQAPKSVRRSAYNEAMFTMTGAAHGNRP
jgi:gluconate 2-dehydrogenase gamma chain